MERDNPRLTDDELIENGLRAWRDREWEGVLDDTTMRIIASQFHGGQASAMYSYASTGAIDIGRLAPEIFRTYGEQQREGDEWNCRLLDCLAECLVKTGDREPVDGWHESTRW